MPITETPVDGITRVTIGATDGHCWLDVRDMSEYAAFENSLEDATSFALDDFYRGHPGRRRLRGNDLHRPLGATFRYFGVHNTGYRV